MSLVLKGMSLKINDKERVGIVGKTVISSLFRLNSIQNTGFLLIDDQDIRKINLYKLRQEISIIPQVPFLFKGTLRVNLDPFQYFDDKTLLNVYVRQVQKDLYNNQHKVWNINRARVIFNSRFLINKRKILILDQATANVDMMTDCLFNIINNKHKLMIVQYLQQHMD
ncbi:unnamed protein product [Paramecium sonneborni]|uniref:ABC transporter domain-containing protein n=1 Tax=Paramecium sonneborni TaxID=65129 RepID=A0A8S1P254_9CILI|nr:unnamed protein product [Paramecium sonneborni]